jgi:hypothetical protein
MKIILLFVAILVCGGISAQTRYPGLDKLVIEVNTPLSIKGTYKVMGTADNLCYTWLDGANGPFWGINDVTQTATTGKFVMVKDSAGVNITNAADLAGNIAVVYYGGVKYKQKMINIQNAGAAAMIIIGASNTTESYPGGNSTATTPDAAALAITIPMFVISNTDGVKIANVLKTETVNGYVGKLKTYDNDLKIDKSKVFAPRIRTKLTALVQEGDVDQVLGLQVKNNGNVDQVAFRAKVKIEFQNNVIYRDSILWFDDSLKLKAHDSTHFFSFKNNFAPKYDLAKGEYKVTYSVNFVDTTNWRNLTPNDLKDSLLMEGNAIDNSYSYTFNVADSVYSVATIRSYTDGYYTKQTYKNVPNWTSPAYLKPEYYAAAGYEQATCMVMSDKNASRVQGYGVTFAAFNKEMKTIKGQLVKVSVYEWADKFTSLNDTANYGTKSLIPIIDHQEYALQDTSVWNYEFVKFDDTVKFENNKRYLVCVNSKDSVLAFGFDKNSVSMYGSYLYDPQPTCPMYLNGTYYSIGWGYNYTPSLALNVSPATTKTGGVGVNELDANASVKVYPNPVSAALNVAFDLQNATDVTVTVTDLSGKVVYTNKSLKGSVGTNVMTIDTKAMNNGMYVLNVISDSNVVSKKFTVLQ